MWRVSSVLSLNGLSTAPVRLPPEALVRGTAVHKVTERKAAGGSAGDIEPYLTPYTDGVSKWFDRHSPTVLDLERRIRLVPRRLTGRVDIFAMTEMPFSHANKTTTMLLWPTVIDVKTGGKSAWHPLQVIGGYSECLAERDAATRALVPADWQAAHPNWKWRAANLYLPGNGEFKWTVDTEMDIHKQAGYLFASAFALTCWRYDHGLLDYTDSGSFDDEQVAEAGSGPADPGDVLQLRH